MYLNKAGPGLYPQATFSEQEEIGDLWIAGIYERGGNASYLSLLEGSRSLTGPQLTLSGIQGHPRVDTGYLPA